MNRIESHSSVNTYKTCPAKYRYHYSEHKRQTKATDAMQLGNLVHEAFAYSLQGNATIAEINAYIDTCFVYNEVQEKAREIARYYAPLIGFGNGLQAYQMNGKRVIEKRFEVEIAGIQIMGYIDAIIQDRHGNVVLVDWKTRAQLLDSSQVAMDNQLYMYAYVVKEVLNIPITKVCQVQIKTTLPAKPKLLKRKTAKMYQAKSGTVAFEQLGYKLITAKMKKEFSSMAQRGFVLVETPEPPALSKTLGATTRTVFIDECIKLGVADNVNIQDYEHKFVDESEFLRMSYIDIGKAQSKTEEFLSWINTMRMDKDHLPINNSAVCKWCQYTDLCIEGV